VSLVRHPKGRAHAKAKLAPGDRAKAWADAVLGPVPPAPHLEELKEHIRHAQRTELRAVPKPPKPGRSESYLDYVRAMPCCACGAKAPSEPHHWGPRGMGQKTSDFRVVPLCHEDHRAFHDTGSVRNRNRIATVQLFYATQVDCLVAWVEGRAA